MNSLLSFLLSVYLICDIPSTLFCFTIFYSSSISSFSSLYSSGIWLKSSFYSYISSIFPSNSNCLFCFSILFLIFLSLFFSFAWCFFLLMLSHKPPFFSNTVWNSFDFDISLTKLVKLFDCSTASMTLLGSGTSDFVSLPRMFKFIMLRYFTIKYIESIFTSFFLIYL